MEGIEEAKRLFEESPIRDVFTRTAMVSGYVQNGNIAQARTFFERMSQRECVSWAAIIAAYAQTGHYEDVLHMFSEKKRDGETINRVAFSCALSTRADLAALELGKQVHGQAVKAGYETGSFVGNALVGIC